MKGEEDTPGRGEAQLKSTRPAQGFQGSSSCCSEAVEILLIRHAETVDNVRHNYAGTTNSPLTNHGVLQAEALAASLVRDQAHYITHIAASTLERAHQTATAVHRAARGAFDYPEDWDFTVTPCEELVERDFGILEGKSYLETPPQPKRPKLTPLVKQGPTSSKLASTSGPSEKKYEATGSESHESLSTRANAFIDSYLIPLIRSSRNHPTPSPSHIKTIAIVSHGILLATLFRELVARFSTITVSPEAFEAGFIMGKTPRWDNTGYTVVRLHSPASTTRYSPPSGERTPSRTSAPPSTRQKLDHHELVIHKVNVTHHLSGLKRTGGGIGSARADPKQRTMKDFFKSKTVKAVAGGKRERDEDTWGLPPSPFRLQPPLPPQRRRVSPSDHILPSSSFLNVPSSSFRTDASSDYYPSSSPPPPLEEEGTGGGLYQVSDLF